MELRRITLRRLFLLGNPDGVDPDSLVHSVSSGRGVPTPCTRRRSPFAQHSSVHPGKNSVRRHFISGRLSVRQHFLHPDISHPDGRGGCFNFSGQTYPDPLVAPTQSDMHSYSVLLKLPDISDRHVEIFWDILL